MEGKTGWLCFAFAVAVLIVALVVILTRDDETVSSSEKQTGEYKEFDREKLDELYRMLVATDYAMSQSGAKYWASCGTLLGAARHKGFIPWDYDIDTQMWGDEFHSKKGLIREHLNRVGYDLSERPDEGHMAGDMARVVRKGSDFYKTDLHMDIFTLDRSSGRPIRRKKPKKTIPCLELGVKNIGEPRREVFGPLTIPVPNRMDDACTTSFGKDWKKRAKGKGNGNAKLDIDLTKRTIAPLMPSENFMDGEDRRLVDHFYLMKVQAF
jgi:hypothetical protein